MQGGGGKPRGRKIIPGPFTGKQLALGGLTGSALAAYLYLHTHSYDLPRELGFIFRLATVMRAARNKADVHWTVADLVEELVAKHGDRVGLVFVDDGTGGERKRSYTFRELDQEANKVANWAIKTGIKSGDIVALMMDNRPEFIFTWLGMTKIGVLTSLINTNLKGMTLLQSFAVCQAKYFIIGDEHGEVVTPDMMKELGGQWISYGGQLPGMLHLDSVLDVYSTSNYNHKSLRKHVLSTDDLMYIYTSGTTGSPKAAKITHLKIFGTGTSFSKLCNITEQDRIYTALPLYHSAATLIGIGISWVSGAALILRRKFSTTAFFKDITTHNATVFQYIGELCRYLLVPPPSPYDTQHKLRLCIGNGLRPDIWTDFQKRFNIPQICEFYGATEGNVGLLNCFNKTGAVGYEPPVAKAISPLAIVRFDYDAEVPVRDPKTGLCIPCEVGETGELLGFIDPADSLRAFKGYTNQEATEKKILRDVFKKGDMYFRTGDLLKVDQEGFYYFMDRIGDTFRWKGENVATTQVAEVISTFPDTQEVNVYGVKVGNLDGRAGMACIKPKQPDVFDLEKFYPFILDQLPLYAAPLFLRLRPTEEIQTTGTFKHLKGDLVKEGFNPSVIQDKLYFRDDSKQAYVPLDEALYERIVSNTVAAKL